MELDHGEIARLTEEYGGAWGINHTRRLLQLVETIAEGREYEAEAVWLAAHLHDWGAYAPWVQKGVDHAVRSVQVAEEFLHERGCPEALKRRVIECIANHHKREAPERSFECVLLFEADALDFLGVVGVLRDFSKNPKDLRKAYEITRKRRESLPGLLTLRKAREMAEVRVRQMDALLSSLEEDSWGCY